MENKKKKKLLKIYRNPQTIYELKEIELSKIEGIGQKTIQQLLDNKIRHSVDRHIEFMLENNIDIISIFDQEYPIPLKQIYDFPISLYCKGNKKNLKTEAIAIVGCRNASEYGKKATQYFAYHLAKQGMNIISGLAKGIDCYAHRGAICAQNEKENMPLNSKQVQRKQKCGNTIAIVGNGLDIVYPNENKWLEKQIMESGGIILSEYPLGTKPERMNFPARNRIISGMSRGVLVVEAKEKSGSLITADFALEQGRDVYVVPGNINSRNSVGTNRLIQQGAELVTHYRDISDMIFNQN